MKQLQILLAVLFLTNAAFAADGKHLFILSGQSNMAGGAGGYSRNDPTLKSIIDQGPYPNLRLYVSGKWQVADPSVMSRFSAIHLSFGYALQKELKIPVGLFYGAVGGTPSGRWLTADMAADDKELDRQFKKANGYSLVNYGEQREALVKKWQEAVKKAKAEGITFAVRLKISRW